jgi:hypothetical protein
VASGTSLIGIEGSIARVEAERIRGALTAAWVSTMGQTPGALADDLELAKRWFDPVAQGQRLRRELAEMRELPMALDDPGPPWTLYVGSNRWLVTPEGRCAVDLLQQFPHDREVWMIPEVAVTSYDRHLGTMYRDWSRHRLESVVALLEGTTKPLQIPAAGVVITLLVNGNVGEERPLVRFAAESARDVVDRAIFAVVNAFADVLAPSRRGKRDARLSSGWMLYEARRRLGDALVLEDFHGTTDGGVWIRADRVDHVIDVVTRDLARGHRARATPSQFTAAFDALVDALRAQLPSLAGFGLNHERPVTTRRLRERLVTRLQEHATSSS